MTDEEHARIERAKEARRLHDLRAVLGPHRSQRKRLQRPVLLVTRILGPVPDFLREASLSATPA